MISFLAWLLWLTIVVINRTMTHVLVGDNTAELKAQGKKLIFAVWHQANFVLFYVHRREKDCIYTASGRRGEILTRAVKRFGYEIVRAPFEESKLAGARSVLQMLSLLDQSYDGVIAVDGPQGPIFKIKPGIIYIAKKSGAVILPIGLGISRKLVFRWRWDKYIFPLPFSRAVINVGPPFPLPEELTPENIDRSCRELEQVMHKLTKEAEELSKG
jgi:hypothetical protein